MLFLAVAAPLVRAAAEVWGFSDVAAHPFMRQFSHYWGGFTAYDLIMPLFIFMCGAAIPLALGRRMEDGRAGWTYWRHVLLRVVLLWILGMVSQGRLLTLDPMRISPYNNTLQTIAAGYLIAAAAYATGRRWVLLALPAVLAAAYSVLLAVFGDYSPLGNFAQVIEQRILTVLVPAGSQAFETGWYAWFLTTLMFGAMTLVGLLSTEVLRREGWSSRRKAAVLFAGAFGLWALGFGAELCGIPCIKHIFTLSFTAQAMGWCVALYGLLYVAADVCGICRGTGLVRLYGQNALACYLMAATFGSILGFAADAFFGGAVRLAGGKGPLVLALGRVAVLTLALWVWTNFKIGRKARKAK